MEAHRNTAIVLALFFLLLSIPSWKDSVGLVYGGTDADLRDITIQEGSGVGMKMKMENVAEGISRLGIHRKLLEDDVNDYPPTGPNPKHDPHHPPSHLTPTTTP